jgi:hypothetical protein
MIRVGCIATLLITTISALGVAPAARADVGVTYEIVSGYIHSVNLEYYDGSQPISLDGAPLPWRTNAMVVNPNSELTDGARLRANWQAPEEESAWVTIRIFSRGSLICESSQTKGKASCYGDHPSLSGDLPARRGGYPEEKVPDAPER